MMTNNAGNGKGKGAQTPLSFCRFIILFISSQLFRLFSVITRSYCLLSYYAILNYRLSITYNALNRFISIRKSTFDFRLLRLLTNNFRLLTFDKHIQKFISKDF